MEEFGMQTFGDKNTDFNVATRNICSKSFASGSNNNEADNFDTDNTECEGDSVEMQKHVLDRVNDSSNCNLFADSTDSIDEQDIHNGLPYNSSLVNGVNQNICEETKKSSRESPPSEIKNELTSSTESGLSTEDRLNVHCSMSKSTGAISKKQSENNSKLLGNQLLQNQEESMSLKPLTCDMKGTKSVKSTFFSDYGYYTINEDLKLNISNIISPANINLKPVQDKCAVSLSSTHSTSPPTVYKPNFTFGIPIRNSKSDDICTVLRTRTPDDEGTSSFISILENPILTSLNDELKSIIDNIQGSCKKGDGYDIYAKNMSVEVQVESSRALSPMVCQTTRQSEPEFVPNSSITSCSTSLEFNMVKLQTVARSPAPPFGASISTTTIPHLGQNTCTISSDRSSSICPRIKIITSDGSSPLQPINITSVNTEKLFDQTIISNTLPFDQNTTMNTLSLFDKNVNSSVSNAMPVFEQNLNTDVIPQFGKDTNSISPNVMPLLSQTTNTTSSDNYIRTAFGSVTTISSSLPLFGQNTTVNTTSSGSLLPFGQSTITTTSSNSLPPFGQNSTSPDSGSLPLFGQNTITTSSSSLPLSGQNTIISSSSSLSLFGQNVISTNASSLPLFGQNVISTCSSSLPLFGQNTITTSSSSLPLFGQNTITTSSSSLPLFGQNVISTNASSLPLFGQNVISTCSSSLPLFGQNTITTSSSSLALFGQNVISTNASSLPLFGQNTITTSSSSLPLFGQNAITTSSSSLPLFGQNTITTSSSSLALFGQNTITTSSSSLPLFGQNVISTNASSLPLFGQNTITTSSSSLPLFGQNAITTSSSSLPRFTNTRSGSGYRAITKACRRNSFFEQNVMTTSSSSLLSFGQNTTSMGSDSLSPIEQNRVSPFGQCKSTGSTACSSVLQNDLKTNSSNSGSQSPFIAVPLFGTQKMNCNNSKAFSFTKSSALPFVQNSNTTSDTALPLFLQNPKNCSGATSMFDQKNKTATPNSTPTFGQTSGSSNVGQESIFGATSMFSSGQNSDLSCSKVNSPRFNFNNLFGPTTNSSNTTGFEFEVKAPSTGPSSFKFGFGSTCASIEPVKYVATTTTDVTQKQGNVCTVHCLLHNIVCMTTYLGKSQEELRAGCYTAAQERAKPFTFQACPSSNTSVHTQLKDDDKLTMKLNKGVQVHLLMDSQEDIDLPSIWRILECPVCLDVVMAPVFVCEQGHHACSVCWAQVSICPLCKRRKSTTRNYVAEALVERLALPCRYRADGCQMIARRTDKVIHEEVCTFRTYKCPILTCKQFHNYTSMTAHFALNHTYLLMNHNTPLPLGDRFSHVLKKYSLTGVVQAIDITNCGLFFLCHGLKRSSVTLWMQMLPADPDNTKFMYQVTLSDQRQSHTMSYKGPVLAMSTTSTQVLEGDDHLLVSEILFRAYQQNSHPVIEVTIWHEDANISLEDTS